jgi:hypothetical protein
MKTAQPLVLYRDRWIECTSEALIIHWYYFPFGKKTIAYGRIRGMQEIQMQALTGKWRIWGSGDLRHWWHLDPGRRHKDQALVLDVGAAFVPVITPDDVAQVRNIIEPRLGAR